MNLVRYIQGIRKGQEINRLEQEAMEDPFLSDALEGYDKVHTDHEVRIKRMQGKISARFASPNHHSLYWSIAASLLLIIGIGGGYLWWMSDRPEDILVVESLSKPADTTVPEILEEPAVDSLIVQIEPKENDNIIPQQQPIVIKDKEVKSEQAMNLEDHKVPDEAVAVDKSAEKTMPRTDTVIAPQPAVGVKAYNEYLKANLVRSTDEECKNATGAVTLSFIIDKNGHPYDIRVVKSLCPQADREAMRLVKEGPVWTTDELYATVSVPF
ncbi:hypothetical protein FACS1894145_7480 [Bacteroidia bacterium]|nr:hypothetical protein FACS1894145_7480 [Bacteroidia bacterium]